MIMKPQRKNLRPDRRNAGRWIIVLFILSMAAGCGTVGSVNRMDENLDAIRPSIEDISAMRESIDVVALELEGVHAEIGQLSEMLDGLDNLERQFGVANGKLDFTNEKLLLTTQELEHLLQLRKEIQEVLGRLNKLDALDEGIIRINGELGNVNEQLAELSDGLAFVNQHILSLESIDNHLIEVGDGVRKLHVLIPLVVFAVPFLVLMILGGIYNQWLTRRLIRKALSPGPGNPPA